MRAKLGQHFLTDAGVARRIAEALPLDPIPHTVIEVGPGRGAITALLAKRAGRAGSAFTCIERDAALAEKLRARAWDGAHPHILTADVRTSLPEIVRELPPGNTYVIAGNLPYYVTGQLLRILGELPQLPAAAVFMVQQEVAERLAAVPPRMNILAASVQAWANVSIRFTVPAEAFSPPPKVESAVVLLSSTRHTPMPPAYYRAVHALFRQPRKTILNNLAATIGREAAGNAVRAEHLDPTQRPQTLTPGTIERLSARLAAPDVVE